MFEKIFNGFFVKTAKKNGMTVMSAKREIAAQDGAVKIEDTKTAYDKMFWDNRGKLYGAIFTSLNGRTF